MNPEDLMSEKQKMIEATEKLNAQRERERIYLKIAVKTDIAQGLALAAMLILALVYFL